MFHYYEGAQRIQREALVKTIVHQPCRDPDCPVGDHEHTHEANTGPGWIDESHLQMCESQAEKKPGHRIQIDKSGGLVQSVMYVWEP
jgi:hypothetical protein